MLRLGLVATTLFVATTGLAGSALADPSVEVGAYVGGDYLGDNVKLGMSWLQERYVQTSPVLGGRLSVLTAPDSLVNGETKLWFGAEVEAGLTPSWTKDMTSTFAPLIGYRAQGIVRYGNKYRAHVVAGVGGETVTSSAPFVSTESALQLYWGLGFSGDVGPNAQLRIDGREGYMKNLQDGYSNTFEFQFSLVRTFGAPAPVEHHHAEHSEHSVARPSTKPAIAKIDPDSDGDGFPDSIDKCPKEAETVNGYKDDDGCPELDSDGDGIPDDLDKCPTQAEDKDGFQDDDGCPDPDNDNDGIPDAADKCPNEAETVNGYQDADGCPDTIPDAIGAAHPPLKFAKGRGKLAPEDEVALKPIIDIMVGDQFMRLRVIAHPTATGRKGATMAQLQADTVRSYLVEHGVTDGNRIEVKTGDVAAKGPAIELQVVAPGKP